MAVTHTMVSVIDDGADSSLVQPSDWNAEHSVESILPDADSTYDLGSNSYRWQNAYVEGIAFPATQVLSADANMLDDYQEGTWTPACSFATPGDLSVAYTLQAGAYTKIGRIVHAYFYVTVSSWTHTTASGVFIITGLPFAGQAGGGYLSHSYAPHSATGAHWRAYIATGGVSVLQLLGSVTGDTAWISATTTHFPTAISFELMASVTYHV